MASCLRWLPRSDFDLWLLRPPSVELFGRSLRQLRCTDMARPAPWQHPKRRQAWRSPGVVLGVVSSLEAACCIRCNVGLPAGLPAPPSTAVQAARLCCHPVLTYRRTVERRRFKIRVLARNKQPLLHATVPPPRRSSEASMRAVCSTGMLCSC
mmetsp:Transcript_21774/g.65124  ORF Transcript_21774/g.65124 Transcript_21774/m.65124 type:complete len:153 (-) Transcript_21774:1557-2015(-)